MINDHILCVLLTSAVRNYGISKMTRFTFFTIPPNGVSKTINALPSEVITGSFITITRFTSRTNY